MMRRLWCRLAHRRHHRKGVWCEACRRWLRYDSYAQGGHLPSGRVSIRNNTGKPIPVYRYPEEQFFTAEEVRRHGGAAMERIQLSRGSVVMSQASIDALSPGMLRRLTGDVDIISAEDALAELDAEDDDS